MIKFLSGLCLLVVLSGCGGKTKPYIDNPYENRMKDFTHMGVKAMHEERWKSAEHSFSRALQMAQLLSDPALEARAWYNDAMAWKAMGNLSEANDALRQGLRISRLHHLKKSAQRAQIQWVILHDGKGALPSLEKDDPADIALSLGYVLAKQADFIGARQAYHQVLDSAGDEKNGLLLQARAMLGLASLPTQVKGKKHEVWVEQALKLLRKVGAPRKTAQALLMVAIDRHYTIRQRRDAAERAIKVYQLLQDKHGESMAEDVLQSMALLGDEYE